MHRPIATLLTMALSGAALAADDGGLAALRARLGAEAPTGAGVGVMQIEAPKTSGGSDFAPDLALADFSGKTVTLMTAPNSVSWHGTNVAQRLFGGSLSMASGITNAWVYNLNTWITDTLGTGNGSTAPAAVVNGVVRVVNHSWIGSFGASMDNYDREAIRRMDLMMVRDGVLAVYGENNGAGSARAPMMGDCFNGISVGRSDLQHSVGNTGALSDTPGRMKPEITAPGQFTSFSTPTVGAAAALLFETLRGPDFSALTNAQRVHLVKAALLGGADRVAAWSNGATTSGANRGVATKPIDAVRGSGDLNVDRAHRIVTGLRVNGAPSATAAETVEPIGWGSAGLVGGGKAYWRFRIWRPAPAFDVTVVWPRAVATNLASYTLANMDLRLQRSFGGGGTQMALEGAAGVATFEGGNVASASTVDNIETIHLTNLQPGEYTLELSRKDAGTGSVTAYASWVIDDGVSVAPGDIDGSGTVDFGDIALAMLGFGGDDALMDMDANGLVDFGDVAIILLSFG
jgi:hypothetical protein